MSRDSVAHIIFYELLNGYNIYMSLAAIHSVNRFSFEFSHRIYIFKEKKV